MEGAERAVLMGVLGLEVVARARAAQEERLGAAAREEAAMGRAAATTAKVEVVMV